MASLTSAGPSDVVHPPAHWSSLCQDDKTEFLRLRHHFHQTQKGSVKDKRLISFAHEMTSILQFLDRSDAGFEQRSILTGIAFAGPFICVNTRQLKDLLGRCKSSINGSFQQLGYVAVRTKSKARTCVLSMLPGLVNEPNVLRQWTVRGASDDSQICFVSRFQPEPLPKITPEDLVDDRPPVGKPVRTGYRPQPVVGPQPKHRQYDFDIAPFPEDLRLPDMAPSFAVEFLSAADPDWALPVEFAASEKLPKPVARNEGFGMNDSEWSFRFGEGPMFDL
jgi:hypothetical protein